MGTQDVPQHSHKSLVTEDDGAWRCTACARSGSPYTLARRQPCCPSTESERKIALRREMLEECLVTTGASPNMVDAALTVPGLDDWLAQAGRHDIQDFAGWLAATEATGEYDLEQRALRLDIH